jgi:hypothetical protein
MSATRSIRFYSRLDGYDEVPVPPGQSIFTKIKEIVAAFTKAGYEAVGSIEFTDRQFKGQYCFVGTNDEVLMEVD